MDIDYNNRSFDGVSAIVTDSLRFKSKLNIGEEVYQSLKLKRYFMDAIDAAGGATAGASIATSATVASTFFPATGFLAKVGIVSAATPVGWAVAAGAIGAGLSLSFGRYFLRNSSSRVKVIPDFINTPLDVLAMSLFSLLGMLSVKLAIVDGHFKDSEREVIFNHFVDAWGYDGKFVERGLELLEEDASNHTIKGIALQLAEFKQNNPDCNYSEMSKELIGFLNEIVEADNYIDEREEMAVERIESVFSEVDSMAYRLTTKVRMSKQAIVSSSRGGIEKIGQGASKVGQSISTSARKLKNTIQRDKSEN